MEKDKKRREVWVIGCDFRDLRWMEGHLVEHLVFFSYIQACCLHSCLLVCLCASQKIVGLQTVLPFATGEIYWKPGRRIAKMLHLL